MWLCPWQDHGPKLTVIVLSAEVHTPMSHTICARSAASVTALLFALGLASSSCSGFSGEDAAFLDQGLNELHALANCYRRIKSKEFSSIKDCSEYARFHASIYRDIPQDDAGMAACGFSRAVLHYVLRDYPDSVRLTQTEAQRVEQDCGSLGQPLIGRPAPSH